MFFLWSTTASRCHCLESVDLTHKNISRAEALTIFQNLQPPLGLQLMLSDISADNNPAHAGHRNPVLFTSSRRCYVPRLQTQLFGKTSREMQHLLLKTTGQQDLAPKSCKVKSILENQNGNCRFLFIQKKKGVAWGNTLFSTYVPQFVTQMYHLQRRRQKVSLEYDTFGSLLVQT